MALRVGGLLSLGLASLASGARYRRAAASKFVAGVPVHLRAERNALTAEDWTIIMAPDATDAQIEGLCQGKCSGAGHPSDGGVPFAAFHGSFGDLEQLLTGKEGVQYVEPDFPEYALPEDDLFREQQRSSSQAAAPASASWGLEQVGVPQRTAHGEGVHIYVVDTGIRSSHADFGGRGFATLDTTEGQKKECKGDTTCAQDRNGHGTHCAGTAAGTTYGVADKATVHGVKTVADTGLTYKFWVFLGMDWITTTAQRPAVMSISLQFNGEDWSWEKAVEKSTDAGITVVVAAGNVNRWSCDAAPAYVPQAITVSSTDPDNSKSSFSNFGTCTNIWAPGRDIVSAVGDSDTGFDSWSGTSMSCPHVSGAVALLLEKDPSMHRDAVMARLTADGKKDILTGLRSSDTNLLLWVGQ